MRAIPVYAGYVGFDPVRPLLRVLSEVREPCYGVGVVAWLAVALGDVLMSLTTDQRQDMVGQCHAASSHFAALAINERHEGNAGVINALLSLGASVDALTAQLAANAD